MKVLAAILVIYGLVFLVVERIEGKNWAEIFTGLPLFILFAIGVVALSFILISFTGSRRGGKGGSDSRKKRDN